MMAPLREAGLRGAASVMTFVMVFAAAPLLAQPPIYGSNLQDRADTRVTLEVKDQPLQDVIKHIAEASGINILLGNGIDEKVTITLNQVPWRVALDLVAERAGCSLAQKAVNVIQVVQPQPVTFNFTGADIKAVIDAIAKVSGASIVVAPEVEGSVHLRVTNVPWRAALDTVVKTLGYVVVEDGYNIYRVVHPSSLEQQMVTRVFPVKYLRPPPRYTPKIDTVYADLAQKEQQGGGSLEDPGRNFTLVRALRGALSANGKLDYFERNNTLVVKDTQPVVSEIERMLAEIDVEPAQVFIDVKFVTTSNTDALSYGFDPGENGLRIGMSLGSIPTRLPFNLGGGGWNNDIIAGNPAQTPGLTQEELKESINYGTLDFTGATFTLSLLEQDDTTRIVQAPRLLALDNQEATIFVGQTIRFAETEAQSNQSGGLTFSIREAANSPVQTGFQLYMVPHVVPGTDKVILDVIPEAEQLTGRGTDPNLPGFNIFRSGQGTENEVQIALPEISSQTLVTTLMLESGQTAVIGGLITESESEIERKLPFLGDIPLLGFFFKSVSKSKRSQSLLIFITPRIVRDSGSFAKFHQVEDRRRQAAIEAEMERIFGADKAEMQGSESSGNE
ncbi:MAG: secretin N-terminal domain-containing protein [Planctomycetota bacterium]|nr:secretin N-terminal domain-containing protein [Planctomycetota bacterium]